ncbi:MAG TPA: amidohydrolase family protein [Candidatus Ozemobacteraceae bacterium]|nr:amidohydrolase family protein [Candidatus Ozemobacteraceae bacterium]
MNTRARGVSARNLIDFHTHLTLHWNTLPALVRAHHPRRIDPLAPLLRSTFWRSYEALRYQNLVRRRSLFEGPLERVLNRIIRSFHREEPEDLLTRMDRCGIAASVVLAVPPVVPNEAVLRACAQSHRLIPFISPLPDLPPEPQISRLLQAGGRGIKVHPLLQHVIVDSDFVTRIAQEAARYQVPLVIHAGGSGRMFGLDAHHRTEPEEFARLARRVPEAQIVIAHAGLWESPEIMVAAAPHDNLFLDVSFQSPAALRELRRRIPPHRLLLGSDSPMGNIEIVIDNCVQAGFTREELDSLFWKNAKRLLGEPQIDERPAPSAGNLPRI